MGGSAKSRYFKQANIYACGHDRTIHKSFRALNSLSIPGRNALHDNRTQSIDSAIVASSHNAGCQLKAACLGPGDYFSERAVLAASKKTLFAADTGGSHYQLKVLRMYSAIFLRSVSDSFVSSKTFIPHH